MDEKRIDDRITLLALGTLIACVTLLIAYQCWTLLHGVSEAVKSLVK